MADSGGIRAGRAFVELSLSDKFSRAIDRAVRRLRNAGDMITSIGKRTLAIGTGLTAPLLLAAQRFAAMGSAINDAAARTGLGVVAVQELGFAAEQTGASFEDVEVATKRMQKTIFEAASGTKAAKEALAGLGLTAADLKNLKPEDQFALIAKRIAAITDPTTRSALALEIFGKSGTKLIPMLQDLERLRARLHELGAVFSPEDVALSDEFGDTLDQVGTQLKAVVFQIGAAVAQALLPFAEGVHRILRRVIDWARANRGVVFTLLAAGAALLALGTTLVTAGISLKLIGVALSGITAAFGAIGTVVGLLTNPIVLVIAALAALAVWFVTSTQTGAELLDWLGGKFTTLQATARTALGGIADALAAGEIGLAMQILWAALKLAWIQGTQELQDRWAQFKAAIVRTAVGAFYGVLSTWAIVQAGLEALWALTSAAFVTSWAGAVQEVTKMFDFLERREREREKNRIQRELAKPGLAANVREQLVRQLDNVDKQAAQVLRAREQQDAQAQAQREQQLQERLAKIQAERDRQLTENATAEQGLNDAANSNARKDVEDLEKQKQELERQLAELRGRATDARKGTGDDGTLIGRGGIDDLDAASRRGNAFKSTGIFNAAALQSLQGSPVQDRIAKATEETAKQTRIIAQRKPAFT